MKSDGSGQIRSDQSDRRGAATSRSAPPTAKRPGRARGGLGSRCSGHHRTWPGPWPQSSRGARRRHQDGAGRVTRRGHLLVEDVPGVARPLMLARPAPFCLGTTVGRFSSLTCSPAASPGVSVWNRTGSRPGAIFRSFRSVRSIPLPNSHSWTACRRYYARRPQTGRGCRQGRGDGPRGRRVHASPAVRQHTSSTSPQRLDLRPPSGDLAASHALHLLRAGRTRRPEGPRPRPPGRHQGHRDPRPGPPGDPLLGSRNSPRRSAADVLSGSPRPHRASRATLLTVARRSGLLTQRDPPSWPPGVVLLVAGPALGQRDLTRIGILVLALLLVCRTLARDGRTGVRGGQSGHAGADGSRRNGGSRCRCTTSAPDCLGRR